jgi:glycosyltransferase involved in cell wall biosynthesis
MADFSILIPTYNRADLLRTALETVAGLAVPDGWRGEVLVVDNNSPDHTATLVETMSHGFPLPLRRVVETKQGLNHARNRGMQEAGGEWLIYLDDDMKVSPGWIHGLADAVRLFGPDVVTGPVFPWVEGEVPAWCTGRVLDSVTSAYSRKGDRSFVLPSDQAHELPGCNFAVKRALAMELGGFHPALDRAGDGMLAGGDFELGMRLAERGARMVYAAECAIQHLISQRKMSRPGLQQRWRGLGVTAKALCQIRGETIAFSRKFRLFLRMHRFRWRAKRLAGPSPEAAFRWELEALWLDGLLFGRIDGLTSGRHG